MLALHWAEVCPRVLMGKLPGRSWGAIHAHAIEALRLPMGVPRGEVSITEAARRLGFASAITVHKLAARHGITTRLYPIPTSTSPRVSPRQCVDWDEIRDACAAEVLGVETVRAAAGARGLCHATLWRWLRDAEVIGEREPGQRSRGFLRVSSTEIDRVVRERRAGR